MWLYRLVLTWRSSKVEALLAASLLAFSWEVSYHTRWVAPDGLLMQFGALTMLARRRRPRERRPALALAGGDRGRPRLWLEVPGGLLLAPTLVAYGMSSCPTSARSAGICDRASQASRRLRRAFVVMTPGNVFEYEEFQRDIEYERMHYGEGGHGVYTLEAGWPHLGHAGLPRRPAPRPSTWRPGPSPTWRCSGSTPSPAAPDAPGARRLLPRPLRGVHVDDDRGDDAQRPRISPFLALFAARASPTWSRSRGRASCVTP